MATTQIRQTGNGSWNNIVEKDTTHVASKATPVGVTVPEQQIGDVSRALNQFHNTNGASTTDHAIQAKKTANALGLEIQWA